MKKMNKKGFTLIELLAIIVILAIIAVITVPLILGIIDEAREKAAKSSVVGYGKAVELSYSKSFAITSTDDPTLKYEGTAVNNIDSNDLTSGKYVKIKLGAADDNDAPVIALRADFSGDKVVCNTSGKVNTIEDGKLHLRGCNVGENTTNSYKYDNGVGDLES